MVVCPDGCVSQSFHHSHCSIIGYCTTSPLWIGFRCPGIARVGLLHMMLLGLLVNTWAFLLGVHLEVELLGHKVCICQPFSVWSSVTAVPTAECDSLGCFTSLPPLDIVWLFHFPTRSCLVVFYYGFNLHFLDDGPWWAPVYTFSTICIAYFMKWLIEIFSSFLT